MKFFATCWLSLVALFSFFASALAEFKWTKLPTEMTIGQTYELAWTGAVGPVTIYTKKDASASSWRAYVYGGGYDTSFNWTLPEVMEPERTYIFSAWDDASGTNSYNSEPIYVHAAPAAMKRGSWVARQW